jgi:hypothetical protein
MPKGDRRYTLNVVRTPSTSEIVLEGLSEADALERLASDGPNELPAAKPKATSGAGHRSRKKAAA